MAAIDSLGDGSEKTFEGMSCGSWPCTALVWMRPVTIISFPVPERGRRRSHVFWIRLRPLPVRSKRNLGQFSRLSGQRRVPAPPAGTTDHRFNEGSVASTGASSFSSDSVSFVGSCGRARSGFHRSSDEWYAAKLCRRAGEKIGEKLPMVGVFGSVRSTLSRRSFKRDIWGSALVKAPREGDR